MKTALRGLILLLIVLWLGGVMFFPVVAATAFSSLPDTHAAGTVVGKCLRILHYEGLFAGTLIVVLLVIAYRVGAYARSVTAPVCFTLIMLALTAFSQFWIIPKMENYRLAAGGAIDAVAADDPDRVAFNKLHVLSEHVEEGVLVAGIVLVVLVALDAGAKHS
jgi:hypothetical protein